jgi:predicted nucleotidyltransferase
VLDRHICDAVDVNPVGRGLREYEPLIERFVELCSTDERILASFLGGSHARAEADDYSDLDLCVITTDEAYEEVVAARAAIVQKLGTPLFLEDFDLDGIVFFILDDGTEG